MERKNKSIARAVVCRGDKINRLFIYSKILCYFYFSRNHKCVNNSQFSKLAIINTIKYIEYLCFRVQTHTQILNKKLRQNWFWLFHLVCEYPLALGTIIYVWQIDDFKRHTAGNIAQNAQYQFQRKNIKIGPLKSEGIKYIKTSSNLYK